MQQTKLKMRKHLLKAWALTLVLCCVFSFFSCASNDKNEDPPTDLYAAAVEDVKRTEQDEIFSLVTLTPDSDMVTWDADGTKVLLLSWHKYPDSYIAGESFTCTYGEIWTFTDREILSWYDGHSEGVNDWESRLEQLIGLPASANYTHFSAFWVDIDEVIRPAYQTDVTKQMSADLLDGSALGTYKEWFDGNAEYSYSEETPYPWTRLGYTYDWADGGDEYGLSEFLILSNSVIEVEWTKTTDEFVAWMEENRK